MSKEENANSVNAKAIAEFIGVSVRRVQQLAQEGVLVKDSGNHGKYLFLDSLKKYIQHMAETPDPLKQARLKKTESETELNELRISRESGELIEATGVEAGLATYVMSVNKLIEGLRDNIKRTWPDMPEEAVTEVDRMVIECRSEGEHIHLTLDNDDEV